MKKYPLLGLLFSLPALCMAANIDTQIKQFLTKYNGSSANTDPSDRSSLDGEGAALGPLLSPDLAQHDYSSSLSPTDYIGGSTESANSERMKDALKNLTTTDDSHAFGYLVSLESLTPLLAGNVKQIQNWSNQLNTMSLLSDVAAASGEGPLRRSQRAANREMERTSIKDESNPSEGQVFIGNIALNALSSTTKNASEEVKFILTICGTIEVTKEEIKFNPPRYKEAIHELLDKQGIRSKIKSLLRGVQQKLISDKTPFSKDEQELIKTTRLPIGSLLTLLTQYKGPGASAALERYADLIAYEQVLQVVEEAAQDMLNKARAYSAVQISSGISELYVAQVEQVVRDLAALRSDQQAKMAEEQRALEFMLQLDHVLKAEEKGI